MAFLPDSYEAPPKTGGHYYKPEDGDNRVRIVGSAIVGWVGWDKSGDKPKPVRVPMDESERICHLNTAEDRVTHFWAFPILDRHDNNIRIWEVTQTTIQDAIKSLSEDPDWGHPGGYDLVISKSGKGKDTKYAVHPKPKTGPGLDDNHKATLAAIDLEEVFTGGDPFASVPDAPQSPGDSFYQGIDSPDAPASDSHASQPDPGEDRASAALVDTAAGSPGALDSDDIPFAPFAC